MELNWLKGQHVMEMQKLIGKNSKLKRKMRNKKNKVGIKDYVGPIRSTEELRTFIANHTGISRCNLSNEMCHRNNKDAAKQIFGF